jgi:hypothetical protein
MLVKQIESFINELKPLQNVVAIDAELYSSFVSHFKSRDAESELDANDLQFIQEQFKRRWLRDTEGDYTLYPTEVNQLWVRLSKEIAPLSGKSYIQVLFPEVINVLDFNNLSSLTDTENPENLYIGYDPRTLFRKRALCEHLRSQKQKTLSSYREISKKNLTPLTVEELSRLKLCKPRVGVGQFSIGDQVYVDFWDFIKRSILPELNSKDEVPIELLPHLLFLIDRYFELQEAQGEFSLFKKETADFLGFLYKVKPERLGLLYGIKIGSGDELCYLLDILITIHTAKDFVIDDQLKALLTWMYQRNSALQCESKPLANFYRRLQRNSLGQFEESAFTKGSYKRDCLTMLLSLFVLKFEYLPFMGKRISTWDKTNEVFSQAASIYALLEVPLANNDVDALVHLYEHEVQENIKNLLRDTDVLTSITRYSSTLSWCENVRSGTLSRLGVNWYQPELLMYALIRHRSKDLTSKSKISLFLDNLVHTYSQETSELQTHLRVNILFHELLGLLEPMERKSILLLLKLSVTQPVNDLFLIDCSYHIAKKLSFLVGGLPLSSRIHFFSGPPRLAAFDGMGIDASIRRVVEIVAVYKQRVNTLKIDESVSAKLVDYLQKLTKPILSNTEQQEVERSVRSLDSIGAST